MYIPIYQRKLVISRVDKRMEKEAMTVTHNFVGHVNFFHLVTRLIKSFQEV